MDSLKISSCWHLRTQHVPIHTVIELIERLATSLDVIPVLLDEKTLFPDETYRRVEAAVMVRPDDLERGARRLGATVALEVRYSKV